MKFEEQLKQALHHDTGHIDEYLFINRLHQTQRRVDRSQVRMRSSLATAVFIVIFGWASFSQLNDAIFESNTIELYTYENIYKFIVEPDSSDYELYIADLALYLLDEGNIWDVLEFFIEEEYEHAF